MIRVPILGDDGRTTSLELHRTIAGSAPHEQSVILLWQRGETRTLLPDGPTARRRSKSKFVSSELLEATEIAGLIAHIAGWEHVFYDGQAIACSRSLLTHVLRVNFVRVQIVQAIVEARALGMIDITSSNAVIASEHLHGLS
ncbi:MAG TPA: hypothetical protein VGM82_00960 [Gemmatimonadaceae bacterium]|jgi:hypothetical protein